VGCSSTPSSGNTGSDDTESSSAGEEESGEESGGAETTGEETFATVAGQTLDQNGNPFAIANGQLCGPVSDEGMVALCYGISPSKGEILEDGTWLKAVPATGGAGNYNLKWLPVTDGDRYFSGSAEMVTIAEGDELEISPVYTVVDVPTVTELSEGDVVDIDMGGGLTLTVANDALNYEFSEPFVGGSPIASEFWRFTEHEGETVVAIWGMAPFSAHTAEGMPGMPFVLNDALGLDPGADVNFWELDKDTSFIHEVGPGTVSADGGSINSDALITHLSWLIVTAPD
jgi:hypothetical protein